MPNRFYSKNNALHEQQTNCPGEAGEISYSVTPFLKRHQLLFSILILLGAGFYFLSIPVALWRASRDLDLEKNRQETFFRVSTLEFSDGTALYGIGFSSHGGALAPLSGTILLLDSAGVKHRMKGGHLCGANGLTMYMHLYRKIQERSNLPLTNSSFLDFLRRDGFEENS